tara:strand:+ start:2448 stop:2909 length:462 start_codon:yes stop_codon:yes gene_type:complete
MEKINWGYVLTLVSSREFVRDVVDYFNWTYGNDKTESLLFWGAGELREEIDHKESWNNNYSDIRKSVFMAKDIIKMNNFKRVAWNTRYFKYIVDRNKSYPRVTKDDVYKRNHLEEQCEMDRRWSCCMPYDCMCYENVPMRQIWTKVNQERKVS